MSTQVAFMNLTHAHARRIPNHPLIVNVSLKDGEYAQGGMVDLHVNEAEARMLLDAAQAALYLLTTEDVTP